ncbi:hypothetical protein HYU15_01670 [Candidatus Woesearchaeota archaeon]|nr:hypothetical protein [Candidatus Woesearchaeota archaeon]
MKAQMSLEFVAAAGAALVIAVILAVAIGGKFSAMRDERTVFLVRDTASVIRSELFAAAEASDGYQRTFVLPHNLSNQDYSITISNTSLILQSENYEHVVKVPSVLGSISKGANIVRKSGGAIYLNS